jgi:hypothetical protein
MQVIWLRTWSIHLIVAIALLLAGQSKSVLAHSNDRLLQEENVSMGLYRLTIWTAPTWLRTGEIHVETRVTDHYGNPDTRCAVYVTLTPRAPSLPSLKALSVPVSGAMAGEIEGLREAAFHVADPGLYKVETIVVDNHGAGGRVAFEVEIIRISPLVQWFICLLLALTGCAALWMLRSGIDLWREKWQINAQVPMQIPTKN